MIAHVTGELTIGNTICLCLCLICGLLFQLDELDGHQRECQPLEETDDSQREDSLPLVVEDIDGVFREIVRTPENFTSSDSHDK